MVAVRATGALWGANTSLLQSLAVGNMYVMRGQLSTVEVTFDFRESANETSAKSARNQCPNLYITPLFYLKQGLLKVSTQEIVLLGVLKLKPNARNN